MECTIYLQAEPVGKLTAQREGLFWRFHCQIKSSTVQRIYAMSGLHTEYLGIPGAGGELTVKLPRSHFPQGITGAVCSHAPRGLWQPWRGEVDGVLLQDALISKTDLALTPQAATDFPAWLEDMRQESVLGEDRLLLPLAKLSESYYNDVHQEASE